VCSDASDAEADIIAQYWMLQRSDGLEHVGSAVSATAVLSDGILSSALSLRRRAAEVFADGHWGIAALDGLVADRAAEAGDFGTAVRHRAANLAFWDHCLPRPSARRAWIFEEFGDMLLEHGCVRSAQVAYQRALIELTYVQPIGSHHCARVRDGLERCLVAPLVETRHEVPAALGVIVLPAWLERLETLRLAEERCKEDVEIEPGRRRKLRRYFGA